MLRARSPTENELQATLARLGEASLSYPDAGATTGDLPAGYHHDHDRVSLPPEPDTFERARAALNGWRVHRGAGIAAYPPNAVLRSGTDVVLVVPLGPLRAVAGCRIVYVVEEPDRFGFGYGTLPGHPEQGEEAFMVERGQDQEPPSFSVTAFSRPANLLVKAGSPIGRLVQRHFVHRYLDAMVTVLS